MLAWYILSAYVYMLIDGHLLTLYYCYCIHVLVMKGSKLQLDT